MESSLTLGRIRGIPIGLHLSWFLIFALVTWSLALGYFPLEYEGLDVAAYWVMGAVTSILFFGSVLLHELGHSIVALRNEIPVHSITLFIFGGVARIGREPKAPGVEFRIAIAGPATSLMLAAGFFVFWQLGRGNPYLAAPAIWLARINLILAVFNMIPGFPLDGGRVLRSIIWKFTGNFLRSTRIASGAGQLIAFGFIGVGILIVLQGNLFNGLWLAFIGWFLQNAAASSYAQANLSHLLKGVKVSQVMSPECRRISGRLPLDEVVNDLVLQRGERCFFVTEGDRLQGMLTLRDITTKPRDSWDQISTEQAMHPWEKLIQVDPDLELLEALHLMDDANVAQVPVVEGDRLRGVLSRERIVHHIRILGEIGM